MTNMPHPMAGLVTGGPDHGVSLVEALVALAIMSFGMLALVGVQATLRHNSDAARERTEAMRLAAQDAESLRAFGTLDQTLVAGVTPWDDLAARSNVAVSLPATTGLTTSYTLDRQVSTVFDRVPNSTRFDGVQLKVAEVKVSWLDRFGNSYAAVLDSAVVAAAPALSARLVIPVRTEVPSRLGTRHATIPTSARDLGDGRSALKPFDQGIVVFVLDNVTGHVTSQCTGIASSQSAITASDITNASCVTVQGRLLTGTVRFDLRVPPAVMDAAVSENPLGPSVLPLTPSQPLGFDNGAQRPRNHSQRPAPSCYADNPLSPSAAVGRTRIDYICVMFPDSSLGWGGKIILNAGDYPDMSPGNWSVGATLPVTHRVCRYTTAQTKWTRNTDHPEVYCLVTSGAVCDETNPLNARDLVRENLRNQNFLVISAAQPSCPEENAATRPPGDLVNSNTLLHQPLP